MVHMFKVLLCVQYFLYGMKCFYCTDLYGTVWYLPYLLWLWGFADLYVLGINATACNSGLCCQGLASREACGRGLHEHHECIKNLNFGESMYARLASTYRWTLVVCVMCFSSARTHTLTFAVPALRPCQCCTVLHLKGIHTSNKNKPYTTIYKVH